jgi:hypothetical protein
LSALEYFQVLNDLVDRLGPVVQVTAKVLAFWRRFQQVCLHQDVGLSMIFVKRELDFVARDFASLRFERKRETTLLLLPFVVLEFSCREKLEPTLLLHIELVLFQEIAFKHRLFVCNGH